MPGNKNEVRVPTGIEADISPPKAKKKEWWKESKHRPKLQSLLKDIEFEREASGRGIIIEEQREVCPPWPELLDEYNREAADERDRPFAANTIERRANALAKLLKFDVGNTPAQCTPAFAKRFRTYLKQHHSPWTARGYFNDIKSILHYAVKRGYIAENGLEGIVILAEAGESQPIDTELLKRILTFTYQNKRSLFLHIATELLTGIRGEDCCLLERNRIHGRQFTFWNSKINRNEPFPITDLLEWVWGLSEDPRSKYILPYRTLATVNTYLRRVRHYLKIDRPITSHVFRDTYAQTITAYCSDPRIFDVMMHHKPSVNKTAQEHYLKADVERMRGVLLEAFAELTPFLLSLPHLAQDERQYTFAVKPRGTPRPRPMQEKKPPLTQAERAKLYRERHPDKVRMQKQKYRAQGGSH